MNARVRDRLTAVLTAVLLIVVIAAAAIVGSQITCPAQVIAP